MLLVGQDAIELGLEPLLCLLLCHFVLSSQPGLLFPPVPDTVPGSTQHNVEVHTVDTNGGIVLDTQIDMLVNTEAEVSLIRETSPPQLVLLDLESSFEDLLSLGTSHRAPAGDFLVPPDTKGSHGEPGLGEARLLTAQLFQDLGGTGQPVTGLAHTDVETQFLNANVAHWILLLAGHAWDKTMKSGC